MNVRHPLREMREQNSAYRAAPTFFLQFRPPTRSQRGAAAQLLPNAHGKGRSGLQAQGNDTEVALSEQIRPKVGVAFCHDHAVVAENLLQLLDRPTGKHPVRCERVPRCLVPTQPWPGEFELLY